MHVSVIIPAYQVAPQVGRCLASVLAQDFRDLVAHAHDGVQGDLRFLEQFS
jgi:glycosyltransferase involved in cell wall biosynthesis